MPDCNRTIQIRQDGTLIKHKIGTERCLGSEGPPGEPVSLASWLPLRPGLSPHGLRHGHQTCLDELGVRYVLQSERMGHEVPGMRGVYTHITPRMRAELRDGLQELWEASLDERVRFAERSAVGILDDLLRAGGGGRLCEGAVCFPHTAVLRRARRSLPARPVLFAGGFTPFGTFAALNILYAPVCSC